MSLESVKLFQSALSKRIKSYLEQQSIVILFFMNFFRILKLDLKSEIPYYRKYVMLTFKKIFFTSFVLTLWSKDSKHLSWHFPIKLISSGVQIFYVEKINYNIFNYFKYFRFISNNILFKSLNFFTKKKSIELNWIYHSDLILFIYFYY